MPTYEYACTSCGHHVEVVQSFSEDPLTTCPECGGDLRKVFGSIGIVLKGSGFYRTDSRTAAGNGKKKDEGDKKERKEAASSGSGTSSGSSTSSGSGGSSDSGSTSSTTSSPTPVPASKAGGSGTAKAAAGA